MNATTNTPEAEGGKRVATATEWLRSWLDAADRVFEQAPPGRPAREELSADRNRLERG